MIAEIDRESSAAPDSGGRSRILVVEDNDFVREMVARLLENLGYEVDTAANGLLGWLRVCERRYHLVVTDHDMPLLTGLQLILRMHAAGIQVPIVMMSGLLPEQIGLPTHGAIASFKAFLPKPFQPGEFLRTIEAVLGTPVVAGH